MKSRESRTPSNGAVVERRSGVAGFIRTLKLESGDKRESDEHARAWRRGFFILVVLMGWTLKNNGDLAHRPEPPPFVIEHEKQTGEYIALGPAAPDQDPQVPDREVAGGRLLVNMYGIDGSNQQKKKEWVDAHVVARSQAADAEQQLYDNSERDPRVIARKNHRSVTIESWDPKASDGSVIDISFSTQLQTLDDQPADQPMRWSAHLESVYVANMPAAKLWDDPDRLRYRVVRVVPAPRLR